MTDIPLVVENLSFKYRTRPEMAIEDISFELRQGELLLIAGSSGCGKTTLARCINGLIPRSYGGTRSGKVMLHGKDVSEMALVQVAQIVGTLLQDPERQIVASNVYNEIAFGPENLGLPRDEIHQRVDQVMKRLKIEHLRERDTFTLSGGEKQKVALAGLLVMKPSILLLDEPLASLDPASAHEALTVFRTLADEGTSILLVEHRVEDALEIHPDRLLYMENGRLTYSGPITDLPPNINHHLVKLPAEWIVRRTREESTPQKIAVQTPLSRTSKKELVSFENVSFSYGPDLPQVLNNINLKIYEGDMIAVLGPNGAGKSTLVKHAIGLLKPTGGHVMVNGEDTRRLSVAQVAKTLGYVFQSPTHMLFAPTVREELSFGPQNLGQKTDEIARNVAESIDTVNLAGLEEYPPLGLSFGQQKRTTIASVLAMRSKIMVMDEPTAGQDYANYTRFMDAMCSADENHQSILAKNFAATLFITHDVDLAVTYANRVLIVGNGQIVADGRPEDVLQDFDFLQRYRVRPSSLLKMNLELFSKTGRFMPAASLAYFVTQ